MKHRGARPFAPGAKITALLSRILPPGEMVAAAQSNLEEAESRGSTDGAFACTPCLPLGEMLLPVDAPEACRTVFALLSSFPILTHHRCVSAAISFTNDLDAAAPARADAVPAEMTRRFEID